MIGFQPQFLDLAPELASQIVGCIRSAGDPLKIVLFGSRARKDNRPESDIDLIVLQESFLPRYQRAAKIMAALASLNIPVDIEVMVYTPAEVEEWGDVPAALITTALREGRVLYEKDTARSR